MEVREQTPGSPQNDRSPYIVFTTAQIISSRGSVAKPFHPQTHLRSVEALVHTVCHAKKPGADTEPGEEALGEAVAGSLDSSVRVGEGSADMKWGTSSNHIAPAE